MYLCTVYYSVVNHHTLLILFFFNDTATTEIYTLSLHDALPISVRNPSSGRSGPAREKSGPSPPAPRVKSSSRSEEHTSELQSLAYLVCRLLLEKKKTHNTHEHTTITKPYISIDAKYTRSARIVS